MALSADELATVRAWAGERIPEGGTEADTAFTNAEIQQINVRLGEPEFLEAIVAEMYRLKAGWVLEDGGITEKKVGSETLKFMAPTALRDHFLAMAEYYDGFVPDDDPLGGSRAFAQEVPQVINKPIEEPRDLSRLMGDPAGW